MYTVMDILFSEHLIAQDKMLQSGLICITCNILQLSEMRTPCYFIKWTDFVVPLVGLYKFTS